MIAFITTSPECLETDMIDVVIVDRNSNPLFTVVTEYRHDTDDFDDLKKDVQDILLQAGWRSYSPWRAISSGYTIPVERMS